MNVFISYNFGDETFVQNVHHYLSAQDAHYYLYAKERKAESWIKLLEKELKGANAFVIFLGEKLGATQRREAEATLNLPNIRHHVIVRLPGSEAIHKELCREFEMFKQFDPITIQDPKEQFAYCARLISLMLTDTWHPWDGLPDGYPFDYEKEIIQEYVDHRGCSGTENRKKGCPPEWPVVPSLLDKNHCRMNPVDTRIIGGHRNGEILVDARSQFHDPLGPSHNCLIQHKLSFPEAGPREKHHFPKSRNLEVGILVSGGIAPGINAVIKGICERHALYSEKGGGYTVRFHGYRDGFRGLLDNKTILLDPACVSNLMGEGGSVLGTSRCDRLQFSPHNLENAVNQLSNTDILYVIGGDGSMRAAHALWITAERMHKAGNITKKPCIVGIPKTMDNDIFWVWQSFGFLSAVQKAKDFIIQLSTEAQSNPRLCIVQLFGSDSGFVVSHAALGSGVCDCVLIPEVPFSLAKLVTYMKLKLDHRLRNNDAQGRSPWGMIIMAETAIPTDWRKYIDDENNGLSKDEKDAIEKFSLKGRRVSGQTSDHLRTGGLKMIKQVLQREICAQGDPTDPYWKNFRVFTNEPRHLIRSMRPSTQDIIFGQRLGVLAVDDAMAGYTDFMVSQWLTEYVLVPLSLVVLGRKRVPQNGMFWKSVIASTGQGEELDPDEDLLGEYA